MGKLTAMQTFPHCNYNSLRPLRQPSMARAGAEKGCIKTLYCFDTATIAVRQDEDIPPYGQTGIASEHSPRFEIVSLSSYDALVYVLTSCLTQQRRLLWLRYLNMLHWFWIFSLVSSWGPVSATVMPI